MSALKIPVLTLTVLTTAVIAEGQAVGYDGDVAAAGAAMRGLAATDAADGDHLAVDVLGTGIAIAGASIAEGTALEVGASGRLIVKNSGVLVARALTAGESGERIEVLLIPA